MRRDEPVCAQLLTSVAVGAVGRASRAAICRVSYYDLEGIWYMETALASTNLVTAELTQQPWAGPMLPGRNMSAVMRGGRDAN